MAAKKGKVPPQFLPGYKKKATTAKAKTAKKTRKKSSKKK
jgi:hypothetical protein